jgi:hypothetical protein
MAGHSSSRSERFDDRPERTAEADGGGGIRRGSGVGDVEQGETREAPSYVELERALSSVPGIVTASVAVSDGSGRGRLRIRLAPGEDPEQVAWAVAATLRERFGITLDPEAIRPRLHEEDPAADPEDAPVDGHAAPEPTQPASLDRPDEVADGPSDPAPGPVEQVEQTGVASEPAPPGRTAEPASWPDATTEPSAADAAGDALEQASGTRVRAAIRDLVTRQGDDDVEVTATLEVAGRRGHAAARAVPTRRGIWRAVAEATVAALRELTDDHLRAGVDRISVTSAEDPGMVTVVLTMLSDRGEETLLGASLLRDDPESAVMRATLDALNRRVEPLLRPATPSG